MQNGSFKHLNAEKLEFENKLNILAANSLKNTTCFKMLGNLGNQMFIHAAATSIIKDPAKILYDISACNYVLDKYGIDINTINLNYEKYIDSDTIKKIEPYSHFNPDVFKHKYALLKSYFQNEKYFLKNKNYLRKIFKYTNINSPSYEKYLNKIKNSNSILLNFRVKKDYQDLGWVIDYSYQKEAMEYIIKQTKDPIFFVFADDIDYVKKTFDCKYKLEFVDIEKNNPDKVFMDLELMKHCKHAIIPNSTFSWWAAWLNENPNKIIVAPDPWLFKESDIVPASWVKIKCSKVYKNRPHIV